MLNMSIVLIAGGTGLIGKHLSALLKQEGFEVRHLSRRANLNAPFPAYAWDPEAGTIDPSALEGISYVINLAGAGIADQPWTKKRKNTIISSRVNGTRRRAGSGAGWAVAVIAAMVPRQRTRC